jgi:dTDP-4-dehydrorhamnose 3,5-epimerase-like enzyme
MITFVDHYFEYEDPRGSNKGLINQGNRREVNLITSSKNSIRGDHYHKRTTELFIILEGEIEVISQRVVDDALTGHDTHFLVRSGDVFMVEPYCNHIFIIKEDSKWMNMLSEPIDKASPDIHRVRRIR